MTQQEPLRIGRPDERRRWKRRSIRRDSPRLAARGRDDVRALADVLGAATADVCDRLPVGRDHRCASVRNEEPRTASVRACNPDALLADQLLVDEVALDRLRARGVVGRATADGDQSDEEQNCCPGHLPVQYSRRTRIALAGSAGRGVSCRAARVRLVPGHRPVRPAVQQSQSTEPSSSGAKAVTSAPCTAICGQLTSNERTSTSPPTRGRTPSARRSVPDEAQERCPVEAEPPTRRRPGRQLLRGRAVRRRSRPSHEAARTPFRPARPGGHAAARYRLAPRHHQSVPPAAVKPPPTASRAGPTCPAVGSP